MKKAALIALIVPMLLLADAVNYPDTAHAQTRVSGPVGGRGGGGGGGYRGGGGFGHGGGYRGGAPGGAYRGGYGHGGYYGRGGHGGYYGHGGHHGGHWSGNIWIGGPWFWDPFFYPFYPYYAYPYPSTTVVVPKQEPDTYIQAPQPEQNYWYYCKESRGYYPYVKRCPGGWMRVVPTPAPPAQEPGEEE